MSRFFRTAMFVSSIWVPLFLLDNTFYLFPKYGFVSEIRIVKLIQNRQKTNRQAREKHTLHTHYILNKNNYLKCVYTKFQKLEKQIRNKKIHPDAYPIKPPPIDNKRSPFSLSHAQKPSLLGLCHGEKTSDEIHRLN